MKMFKWIALIGCLQMTVAYAAEPAPPSQPIPAEWSMANLSHSLSFEMTSKFTGQSYRILIGLPHEAAPPSGYPVLWMLDGLASFPAMEPVRIKPPVTGESTQWRAEKGSKPAGLIVAIAYASGQAFDVNARALDYTPAVPNKSGDTFSTQHGGADAFLQFLTQELRPLIAQHFTVDPQRNTLFGFSYGGLFTLYVLSTQPGHFQRYWAASPSLWFGEASTLQQLPQRLTMLNFKQSPARICITIGQDEQYPTQFASPAVQAKLQERAMVDRARSFAEQISKVAPAYWQVTFYSLPEHDHLDTFMHGVRRISEFAFAP